MILNYFKIALRNLVKNRLYSLINVFGLAIGLASCLLIALFVQNETSYDEQWADSDRIYRVNRTMQGEKYAWTSLYLRDAFSNYFSGEIESATRFRTAPQEYRVGNVAFQERIALVDADFIDMFQLEILAGSMEATLSDLRSIALSTEYAERLFGDANAVGETVSLLNFGESREFLVTAVYNQPAANTVLEFPAIARFDESILPSPFLSWRSGTTETYVKLPSIENVELIHELMPDFVDQTVDISSFNPGPEVSPREIYELDLQAIQDIYLNSAFDNARTVAGNPATVAAFSAIAVLVLLIGCINFTVLSTARATARAKEVALRKVVGAGRKQLLVQFLGETFLTVLPAVALALVLVDGLLPFYSTMAGKEMALPYGELQTWAYLTGLLVLVTCIGGLYPAFVLSHFQPKKSLTNSRSTETKASLGLRNALVVFQFGVSTALMIATAVIWMQVRYVQDLDPGFDKNNLLLIDNLLVRPEVRPQRQTLKQEIATLTGVSSLAFSGHRPMQVGDLATSAAYYSVAENGVVDHSIATMFVDYRWFATYGINLITGRDFSAQIEQPLDSDSFFSGSFNDGTAVGPIIVNQSAVRELGFISAEDAIGKVIRTDTSERTIIGVVEDTQFISLRTIPRAETYLLAPENAEKLTIRYQGDADALQQQVLEVWESLMGTAIITLEHVDQLMAGQFVQEEMEAQFLVSFSLLALLIACLGLYGSAAFSVDRRTREIGIRKILGAQVREIVSLLMWQFSKPVLLANFIAWPVAIWLMLRWLQRFPYQIDTLLLVPLCVLAGFIALSIAWLTVASNTVRVARANPVLALRYE